MHGTDSWFHINGLHIHCKAWKNPISTALPLVILHGLWESWHTFTEVADFTSQPSVLKRAWFEMTARDFLHAADGPFVTLMNNTVTEEEWTTLLGRIAVPTLVLAASPADGGWMGEEHHTLVREALPSARLVDFPGCGHHIEATCTESFLATVEAFLDDPMQEARGSVAL